MSSQKCPDDMLREGEWTSGSIVKCFGKKGDRKCQPNSQKQNSLNARISQRRRRRATHELIRSVEGGEQQERVGLKSI